MTNAADAIERGRSAPRNKMVLTAEQASNLRSTFNRNKHSLADWAQTFGVSTSAIRHALLGITFKDIDTPPQPPIRVYRVDGGLSEKVLKYYVPRSKERGLNATAKHFGIGRGTVERMVKGTHCSQVS